MPKKLTQQIHSLKALIKDLEQLENNDSAQHTSQLLKIMTSLFEEVEQRLKKLEQNAKKKKTPPIKRNH